MNTEELRKSKELLMEYSKKELERVDEQIRLIKSDLEQHHYICSECNTKTQIENAPKSVSIANPQLLFQMLSIFRKNGIILISIIKQRRDDKE